MDRRSLIGLLTVAGCALALPVFATSWISPDNYTRSPSGSTPSNPVTLSAEFDSEDGCTTHAYRFWVFDGESPQYGLGTKTNLENGVLSQTVYLPDGVSINEVRLACVDADGNRSDSGGALESGSPAFTPQGAAPVWNASVNYARTPTGTTPSNPITLSAEFGDETGCSNKTYRFWAFNGDGSPVSGIGSNKTLKNNRVQQTANIPAGTGITAVRLACTDASGNYVSSSSTLESGSPAFTPQGTSTLISWENPADYTRSPNISEPYTDITLSAAFNDESACPGKTYSFWVYNRYGEPISSFGSSVPLTNGHVTQTGMLPTDVGVDAIRLACTFSDGSVYGTSGDLESGTPAFTPRAAPLIVSEGGTGVRSFTTNGVLLGNGASSILATAAGSASQVFRIPNGGGAPSFGALDLSQSAAVTGILAALNGGTGASTTFTNGSIIFAGTNGVYSQNNTELFWDNVNQRLGVGTSTPITRLEVNGTLASTHVKGTGAAPSIAAGSGCGTGCTASITGTDTSGEITVNSGLLPSGNATVVTVTFATPYGTAPNVIFSPSNASAALLSGATMVHADSSTTTFTLISGSTALLASGTLTWFYHVIE